MLWFQKFFLKMDKNGGAGGGGGGGDKTEIDKLKEENDRLKKENDSQKAELEKVKAMPPKTGEGEGDDLQTKAQKEKAAAEAQATAAKRMEVAIKFNLGVADFVKNHKDLLPESVENILKVAGAEKYDTEVERATAVKVAFIKEFFSVQKNVDALTESQRNALNVYLGSTKIAKDEKVDHIWENIFEPTVEVLKKIKKAEELAKGGAGFTTGTAAENKYRDKLVKASRSTYLGEKGH